MVEPRERGTCSIVPCSDLTQEGSVVQRVSDSDQWYQPLFLSCGWMSTGIWKETQEIWDKILASGTPPPLLTKLEPSSHFCLFSSKQIFYPHIQLGFPDGSAGKESACNVGKLGWIPGLGRSPREGKDYPLQYSGLKNSMDCNSPWGHRESDTTEQLSLSYPVTQPCLPFLQNIPRIYPIFCLSTLPTRVIFPDMFEVCIL